MKRYVIIASVNGAGKSTLYLTSPSLKNLERINTDEILREWGDWRNPADVIKAGKIAIKNFLIASPTMYPSIRKQPYAAILLSAT